MCASPKQADATSWGMTKQASGPALPHTLQVFRLFRRTSIKAMLCCRTAFYWTDVRDLQRSATAAFCTGAQTRHPAIKKRMSAGSATQVSRPCAVGQQVFPWRQLHRRLGTARGACGHTFTGGHPPAFRISAQLAANVAGKAFDPYHRLSRGNGSRCLR